MRSASAAPGAVALAAVGTAVIVTSEFIVVGLLPGMARDLGASLERAGNFVSGFALASALAGPPLTMLLVRFDARRVLATVLLVYAVTNTVIAAAPGYGAVLGARLAQGALLPAFVSIGVAAVAGRAGARGGRAVANVNIGVIAASVFAVPAGVLIADVAGWPASFVLLAGLAGAAALMVRVGFPACACASPPAFAPQLALLREPRLIAHLALTALLFVAMFAAYTYFAALLEGVAGFDERETALALFGFGVAGLAGNWLAGRGAEGEATRATAAAALALGGAQLAASTANGCGPFLALALAVWGAAHAALFVLCHLRAMRAAPQAPAFAGALNISVCNIGVAAGAAAGGAAVATSGVSTAGMAGAAVAFAAFVFALFVERSGNTAGNVVSAADRGERSQSRGL
ncbi:MAG TPA: MFS transporter [Burkholderiales bacterium]